MSVEFSIGLLHEVVVTAAKVGFQPKQFADLAHSEEKCQKVLAFLLGHAEIKDIEHLIDLDADPFLPGDWQVESHQKGGMWKWDLQKVKLHLDAAQTKGSICGHNLRKKLETEKVLNANVLDYLLANQYLIPEEWKGKYIFFWGTIYRNSVGSLFVRCLRWDGDRWDWGYYWLGFDWDSGSPAACAQD